MSGGKVAGEKNNRIAENRPRRDFTGDQADNDHADQQGEVRKRLPIF
jgi:hypothetical protein